MYTRSSSSQIDDSDAVRADQAGNYIDSIIQSFVKSAQVLYFLCFLLVTSSIDTSLNKVEPVLTPKVLYYNLNKLN